MFDVQEDAGVFLLQTVIQEIKRDTALEYLLFLFWTLIPSACRWHGLTQGPFATLKKVKSYFLNPISEIAHHVTYHFYQRAPRHF